MPHDKTDAELHADALELLNETQADLHAARAEVKALKARVAELEQELPAAQACADLFEEQSNLWQAQARKAEEAGQRQYDENVSLIAKVAAAEARATQAEEEAEKWRTAARVLCGAHVGVPQPSCPVCAKEQAEQALQVVTTLVRDLQAHATEHGWQDCDDPIARLLEWRQ